MAKFTNSNRGSTKESRRGDWRTPKNLHKAIAAHYDVAFVLDAAASAENTLCPAFLTEKDNTLSLSLSSLEESFRLGLSESLKRTIHPIRHPAIWTNPDYNDGEEMTVWMDLAGRFSTRYRIPWIFLVPGHRSEQDWFHRAMEFGPQLCYPKGRINYDKHDGTPSESGGNHPSVILAFEAPPAGPRQVTTLSGAWRKWK
jgi:phage N-6-adenine-methyltransferase